MVVDIYTKNGCTYCNWAKTLLQSRGILYNERNLGSHFNREFILENFPTAKTFPVIVIDGMNVGGYEGLKEYLKVTETPHHNMQLLTE